MRSDKAIEAKRALTEICKMRFESKENTRVLKALFHLTVVLF